MQLSSYAKSLAAGLLLLPLTVVAPAPASAAAGFTARPAAVGVTARPATVGVTARPAVAGVTARPAVAPSFNGTVYAVAYRGDTVYVGGAFSAASSNGRSFARRGVAAFSASSGALLPWAPAVRGTVKALAVAGRSVYLAGDFYWIGSRHRDGLAALDATTAALTSFDHSVRGEAAALTIGADRLYVGGMFSSVDGSPRANLAAFSLASGRLDQAWHPRADNRVEAVLAAGNRVYAGGKFRAVNRARGTSRLAAVNAVNGELDPRFRPYAPDVVFGLAVDAGGVYTAAGGPGGRATAYTSGGVVRWTHLFNGDLHAIVAVGGMTYVGGHFDTACARYSKITQYGCLGGKVSRVKLAAVDSRGALASWNPHANGVVGVLALATNGRQVAAGGQFTQVGGRRHEYYAAFG